MLAGLLSFKVLRGGSRGSSLWGTLILVMPITELHIHLDKLKDEVAL